MSPPTVRLWASPGGGPPRLGRSLAVVALAGLTSAAAVGCQSVRLAEKPGAPPAVGPHASTEPAAPKTEFHRKVSPANQFNVFVELGRVHEAQGNFEAAVGEYQKAVDVCATRGSLVGGSRIGPAQQALAHRRMAAAFDRMGRFTQSETHYAEAMKLAPDDPKVWNDAGYSLYLQSRWADAERALKTADAMKPNDPRVLTNLGLVLTAQGKEKEALTALSRAGGPAIGHANLAFLLAAMGKTAEAREHYSEALSLQPELAAAREALARLDAQPKPPTALAHTAAPAGPVTPPAAPHVRTAATPVPPANLDLPMLPPGLAGAPGVDPNVSPTAARPAR